MKRSIVLRCLPLLLLVLASCSSDPKVQAQRYVDNGNKFFAKAKYKEAAIMYRKAIAKSPLLGESYYRMGLTALKLGGLGDAVGMFRRAVDLQPENSDAAVQLATIYVFAAAQNGQQATQLLEEAAGLAEKILAKDPNSFDGLRIAGQIALLKNDTKTAVAHLEHANRLKPNSPEIVLVYFEALVRNNQKEVGEKMVRDFIDQQKNYGPAYDRLYYQYMVDKQPDDAEKILKLKVANNPKSANYLLQLATHYVLVNRRPDMDAVIRTMTDEKQFPDGHLMAGDFYFFRMKEFELAKQQYEAGMKALPKDKAVYQKRLVELYASTGSNAEANQLVDALLKENPKDSDAIAMHAALLLTSGKPEQVNQAAIDLQSLVSKNPNNHLLRFNYARALLAKGQIEPARLQLEDALKTRPDFVSARELLARIYLVKQEPAKALQAADDLLKIDGRNLTGHLARSAALLALKDTDKARAELDLITKLFPQNPDARYQVGLLAWQDKDYKKAEQTFGSLYRDNHDSRGLMGITETMAAQNHLDEAIKEMDKAIAAEPARQDLKLARANLFVRAQRYDDAIATFKGLLEKEPASADLLFRLAETYRRKGDINLAAETFRKSSQAAPTNALPLVQLGLILETIGPLDQAKAVYEQILKLDPNNAIALNNLAYRKAEEGLDLDSALTMAQRARQIQPNATAMADTLGWIYIKKNMSGEAERIFKDLVGKDPNNPMFHYHYGMALMQKGDKSSAKHEFEVALKNKPSKDDAGKIQDLLNKL
ncbi:MAG: tetratricopeptide repeat protein [Acidobacteriia bacterium]|nr:tetratricopeptide repeat protein [Terriglobia bacterium]